MECLTGMESTNTLFHRPLGFWGHPESLDPDEPGFCSWWVHSGAKHGLQASLGNTLSEKKENTHTHVTTHSAFSQTPKTILQFQSESGIF